MIPIRWFEYDPDSDGINTARQCSICAKPMADSAETMRARNENLHVEAFFCKACTVQGSGQILSQLRAMADQETNGEPTCITLIADSTLSNMLLESTGYLNPGRDENGGTTVQIPRWAADIADERKRQDKRFGGARHDDLHTALDWSDILEGYVDGLCEYEEVTEGTFIAREPKYSDDYRERLVKIAAVAVAALESFDRKEVQRQCLSN